ncbi:MAG: DUF4399 domain-containing protein [Dokdonella sp.]|uniref:DUF4399 domain-containing protein n=1 Tax=Dokdonella sp. TaxID=2291710 RepID=UPI0032661A86
MRAISSISCGFALAILVGGAMPARAEDKTAASAMTPEKAPAGAKVSIVSPKDGATVGQDVTVEFGVEGIALLPATEPRPNSGHHHLLIDAKDLPPGDAPIPADVTHKHYGKAQASDTVHLEPGTHTLQLDFGDARHMQFDPPIASKKITIHVK